MLRRPILNSVLFIFCAVFALPAAEPEGLKIPVDPNRKAWLSSIIALDDEARRAAIVYGVYHRTYSYPTNSAMTLALVDLAGKKPRILSQMAIHSGCRTLQKMGDEFALYCEKNVELYQVPGDRLHMKSSVSLRGKDMRLLYADDRLIRVSKGRLDVLKRDAKGAWALRRGNVSYKGELVGVRDGKIYSVGRSETVRRMYIRELQPGGAERSFDLNDFCCPGDAIFAGPLLALHDFELQLLMIIDYKAGKLLKTIKTQRYHSPSRLPADKGMRLLLVDTDRKDAIQTLEVVWNGEKAITEERQTLTGERRINAQVQLGGRRIFYMTAAGELIMRKRPLR